MLKKIYDQSGHLLKSHELQQRNDERWSKMFSQIPDNDNQSIPCLDQSITAICRQRLKFNRIQRLINESNSNSNAANIDKENSFNIPQFVIDGGNSSVSSKPQSSNMRSMADENPRDFLKISNDIHENDHEVKPRKLQIGVADFAKKVKDNEGMGISTFINEDEKTSTGNEVSNQKGVVNKNSNITISALRTDHFIKMCQIASDLRRQHEKKTFTPMEKFYHGVRITQLLMKTCRTSSEQTRQNNNKFLTFADYQDNQEIKSNRAFDVTYYKCKKEKTLNSESIEVLVINPKMRSTEMLHVALLGLNSTVEAFGEFPLSMQESLIERGWYEKFESKRTIIRQGHSALNFYLIISGITVVSVARQNKATGETYSETVAFLKRGNSFGELALMFGGKRSATVSCKTDVELLAVSRDDFIDIFMSVSTEGEPDHISFLRKLPLLDQWPIDELPYDDPTICLFTYFRRGTVLCHDSNHGDWVYIVKSGTCRIIKHVQLEPKHVTDEHDQNLQNPIFKSEYLTFLTQESMFGSNKNSKSEIPPAPIKLMEEVNGKFYIQLKVLGVGSIFGIEPMAFELVGGTTGVTLVSDGAELIAIGRKFFQMHMTRQYQSWLRKEIQPFPTIESLKSKLRNFYRWTDYKEKMIKSLTID